MTADRPATEPRTEVLARHVEATICAAPFSYEGDGKRPSFDGECGHYERHPVHDLYPDTAKRDPLQYPYRESDRHAYQPQGRGICAADEDEWPCAAYRLAEAAQGAAPRAEGLPIVAVTRDGVAAAEWHRYLHQEGMLVADEGEECGPWHHRVFLGESAPRPSDERVPESEEPR